MRDKDTRSNRCHSFLTPIIGVGLFMAEESPATSSTFLCRRRRFGASSTEHDAADDSTDPH